MVVRLVMMGNVAEVVVDDDRDTSKRHPLLHKSK